MAFETDPASNEYVPAGHGVQSPSALLPLVEDQVPGTHNSQEAEAGDGWNEPAGQSAQVAFETDPATEEYVPAGHGVQSLSLLLPFVEDQVPGAHNSQ